MTLISRPLLHIVAVSGCIALEFLGARVVYGMEDGLQPTLEGILYEVDSNQEEMIFTVRLESSQDGQHRRAEYLTPRGNVATTQELILEYGEFKRFKLVHHEAAQVGQVRRIGERVEFTYTENGKTRTRSEGLVPNFVVGPMIVPYIQSHWKDLDAGEKLEIRFGVPHRLRSYGFRIVREKRTRWRGQNAVVLKVRPSNFILSKFIDPIYFTFSPDGRRVLEFVGRTAPLQHIGGRWRPTVATGVFTPVMVAAPPDRAGDN